MSKATSDPGTPIFGELNSELELPEIDVHDFEWHEFDFPEGPSATQAPDVDTAKAESDEAPAQSNGEQNGAGQAAQTKQTKQSKQAKSKAASARVTKGEATEQRGGRRRKEE